MFESVPDFKLNNAIRFRSITQPTVIFPPTGVIICAEQLTGFVRQTQDRIKRRSEVAGRDLGINRDSFFNLQRNRIDLTGLLKPTADTRYATLGRDRL